eukprot:CAMPEP_0113561616 /NCGR_PEP_ID=MMETSP0015_2-20120614/20073_1 /TAXON_ID=2838 /ORGANISM="Odontella" /LENGTH=51 /DNA_ID=CAMNT_0000463427 /DNA_START=54 /DNA_END=209 /DNA_ORIENTATION=+ /assembly_acc=CAM_ASM_000160
MTRGNTAPMRGVVCECGIGPAPHLSLILLLCALAIAAGIRGLRRDGTGPVA